jgi:tetratricopeptide (TPR) repeat protein
MTPKENEVDWKSALSIKRALVKRNLSTKTPNLRGDARLEALQTRLKSFLTSEARVNIIKSNSGSHSSSNSRPLSASSVVSTAESMASDGLTPRIGTFTPRDIETLNSVASLKEVLECMGLSTRTPGLKGEERVKALKERLITRNDGTLTSRSGGLRSSRSEGSKTWRENHSRADSMKSNVRSNYHLGSISSSYKYQKQYNAADIEEMKRKLAEMEGMVRPPIESPPQSPKPPNYDPPLKSPTTNDSSAIYWSGWNNTNDNEKTNAKAGDESNSMVYEKAYRENNNSVVTNTTTSNSNSNNTHYEKHGESLLMEKDINIEKMSNVGFHEETEDAVNGLNIDNNNLNSANNQTLSSHMGNAWSGKGRPGVSHNMRGGIKRRGGGMTRGMSRRNFHQRGKGIRINLSYGHIQSNNKCPVDYDSAAPTSARLNSRFETLTNMHNDAKKNSTEKENKYQIEKNNVQSLKEQLASLRSKRDAVCAERSDPAYSPTLAKLVERLSKIRLELDRARRRTSRNNQNFDTDAIHGNVMQRFPIHVAISKLETIEKDVDNKIDQFCTHIVKEEEQNEQHGLKQEQQIKRTLSSSKKKMELCEKEMKETRVIEKHIKKKVEEELERRSQRPPFSAPEATKDPWKLCQNARFLWRIRGEDDTAGRVFAQAYNRDPENSNILHGYAEFLHEQRKEHAKAMKLLQSSYDKNPKHVSTLALYGHILHRVMSENEKGETMLLKCLDISPKHVKCLISYALLLSTVRMDFNAAERCFKQALEVSPKDVTVMHHYARFLKKKRGDYNGAEKLYKEALKIDPCHPKVLSAYANFLMKVRGDYPKAEKYYQAAVMVVPHSATALGNLANFFQRVKGNPAIAQEFYLKAMQHDPNHPSVKRNYAILLRDFPELRTPNTERSVGTPSHIRSQRVSNKTGNTLSDNRNSMPIYQPQIPINPHGRSRTPNRRARSRSPSTRRSRSPATRRSRSPGGRRSQSPARIRRLASRQGTPQIVKESSLDVVVEATPRTEAGLRTGRR